MPTDTKTQRCPFITSEYVDLCRGVALALTRDETLARELADDVLGEFFHTGGTLTGGESLKMTLLTALRGRFLACYSPLSLVATSSNR